MSKKSIYSCDCNIIHENVLKCVKLEMKEIKYYDKVLKFFKLLGDDSRLKIVLALSKAEMCVCDISALLNNTKSAISHQLKVLREANILKNRRIGRQVYYSLNDEHVKEILEVAIIHAGHDENYME